MNSFKERVEHMLANGAEIKLIEVMLSKHTKVERDAPVEDKVNALRIRGEINTLIKEERMRRLEAHIQRVNSEYA